MDEGLDEEGSKLTVGSWVGGAGRMAELVNNDEEVKRKNLRSLVWGTRRFWG